MADGEVYDGGGQEEVVHGERGDEPAVLAEHVARLAGVPYRVLEVEEDDGALETLAARVVVLAPRCRVEEEPAVEDAAALVVERGEAEALDDLHGRCGDALLQGFDHHELRHGAPRGVEEVVEAHDLGIGRRGEQVGLPRDLAKDEHHGGLVDGVRHLRVVGRRAGWREDGGVLPEVLVDEVAREAAVGVDAVEHAGEAHVEGDEEVELDGHVPHAAAHLALVGGDGGAAGGEEAVRVAVEAHFEEEAEADGGEDVAVHLGGAGDDELGLDVEDEGRDGGDGGAGVPAPDEAAGGRGAEELEAVHGRLRGVDRELVGRHEGRVEDAEGHDHEEEG